MLCNVALFSSLLLARVVLAVSSGLGARVARRRDSNQFQVNNPSEQATGVISSAQYTPDWAGAVYAEGNGTFSTVTGTFTVPTPSGSNGASAAAWVGIDGYTCTSATLQAGVTFFVESPLPAYTAWYMWYPSDSYEAPDPIEIFAGDAIKLTVVALSLNAGNIMIENLTNGQRMSKSLNSSTPLCGQNVAWIVGDYTLNNNSLDPLADFGTVTFTNAVATGTGSYDPSGATILDIKQNNEVLTNVTTDGTSVTIQYV